MPVVRVSAVATLVALAVTVGAGAQSAAPEVVEARVPARAVTVYPGRASVTRTARAEVAPGTLELHFVGLPDTIDPTSIVARAQGPARVVGVDYREQGALDPSSPRLTELDRRLEAATRELAAARDGRDLLQSEIRFLDGMAERAAAEAAGRLGTEALDLDVVRKHLAYLSSERARLHTERRVADALVRQRSHAVGGLQTERDALTVTEVVDRTAVVSLNTLAAGEVGVDLTYLVANAQWGPRYDIRSYAAGAGVSIEFLAVIEQDSGEDWNDVELILSTTQPTVAATPPTLRPWYVDVVARRPAEETADDLGVAPLPPGPEADLPPAGTVSKPLQPGVGPAVTYALGRRVTVRSGALRQQRAVITTIETMADFVHVAMPLVTEAVHVRATLSNTSVYQLLPGPAGIFVGSDFVGPTRIEAVAPGATFEVAFGVDRSVVARREMVMRKTSKTGLLGGGRRISYEFRIEIDNGAGKPIQVELWDRRPVSRSDRIEIRLVEPSHAPALDPEYVEDQAPQGLLKWLLSIPAGAMGSDAFTVTYGLTVVHPKDVVMSELPE